ncbi:MAG: hypothetical protein J3R72DRAFT_432162 [Linnemannia gamsii]|nr:MAG: hypothetical protein J3R72DRAFT_432162 [Linnemannia gamsii]
MSSTSPFNIPHIVDSICDHLNLNDIVDCKKVCKDWSDVFAPYEWRSLHLANIEEHCIPSPRKRNLILKHAHRIESLTIHQDDIWLLQSSSLNFKRLIYVHVIFFLYPCDIYLSTHSSLLQDLSHWTQLRLSYPGQSRYDSQVTNDAMVVAMALSDCPPNVESLHVSYYFSWYGAGKPHTPQNHPSSFILPWEPLPLRKFHFDCDLSCSFKVLINIGLIPFLKNRCPLLEDLSLPSFPEEDSEALMKTIGAHCPKLQYLRLNNGNTNEAPIGSEVDHFSYITQSLKFLRIDLDYKSDTTVLEPLQRNGSDALEALEFLNTECYFSGYVPPYDWFPNLKTMKWNCGQDLLIPLKTTTIAGIRHKEDAREYYTSIVNM